MGKEGHVNGVIGNGWEERGMSMSLGVCIER